MGAYPPLFFFFTFPLSLMLTLFYISSRHTAYSLKTYTESGANDAPFLLQSVLLQNRKHVTL